MIQDMFSLHGKTSLTRMYENLQVSYKIKVLKQLKKNKKN